MFEGDKNIKHNHKFSLFEENGWIGSAMNDLTIIKGELIKTNGGLELILAVERFISFKCGEGEMI